MLARLLGKEYQRKKALARVGPGPLADYMDVQFKFFNSPDLNGDRFVNLSDLVEFTEDYYTGYYFRSDFHRDGALILCDVDIMASSLGKGCPRSGEQRD